MNKELKRQFEQEKGYPSWNCNDTVIMEYLEWLENKLSTRPSIPTDEDVKRWFAILTGQGESAFEKIMYDVYGSQPQGEKKECLDDHCHHNDSGICKRLDLYNTCKYRIKPTQDEVDHER